MEDAEPDAELKAKDLIQTYQDSFFYIAFTLHPFGVDGEVRGKSSNVSYAAREMIKIAGSRCNDILTVMDADTCFAQDYFSALSCHYALATPEERELLMFTPCTVFDRYLLFLIVVMRIMFLLLSVSPT
jgi:hypothetical protein